MMMWCGAGAATPLSGLACAPAGPATSPTAATAATTRETTPRRLHPMGDQPSRWPPPHCTSPAGREPGPALSALGHELRDEIGDDGGRRLDGADRTHTGAGVQGHRVDVADDVARRRRRGEA